MKKPVIALAQIKYFDIHKKNNIEKIKRYIRLAKKFKADIVCFPESCLHKTDTLHFDDKFINEIKQECKKNSIWCIINEEIILKKTPFNLALLISRQGKISGFSKKIHLYGDSKNVKPGKKIKVFKTDFAKIGIVICWDLAFPELFKKMKNAGAEIVFCPAAWCYEEKAYDKHHKKEETKLLRALISARAFENLYFVALCNPVVNREDQVSYSAICSPHKILKEIIDKEGLITAKINLKEIKKLCKIYPKD
jgi:predicted amidohydrolase